MFRAAVNSITRPRSSILHPTALPHSSLSTMHTRKPKPSFLFWKCASAATGVSFVLCVVWGYIAVRTYFVNRKVAKVAEEVMGKQLLRVDELIERFSVSVKDHHMFANEYRRRLGYDHELVPVPSENDKEDQ